MNKKLIIPIVIVILGLIAGGVFYMISRHAEKTVDIDNISQNSEKELTDSEKEPINNEKELTDSEKELVDGEKEPINSENSQKQNNMSAEGLALIQDSKTNYAGGTFATVNLPGGASDEEIKTAVINSMNNAHFNGMTDKTVDLVLTAAYILNGSWEVSIAEDQAPVATYAGTNPAGKTTSVAFIVNLADGTFTTSSATQGEIDVESGADLIAMIIAANYSN